MFIYVCNSALVLHVWIDIYRFAIQWNIVWNLCENDESQIDAKNFVR